MLSDQILKTLEYFDIQDHPLTLMEVSRYLLNLDGGKKASLVEILNCLNEMAEKVKSSHGFYYLTGREALVKRRLENNFYSTPRLNRAKKYLSGARLVPFISAVALNGSEAMNNSKQGSDIDLLVLTKPSRIWLGRLFLSFYFHIFGVRRYSEKIENRFCLNHYLEENKLINREKHLYSAIEYLLLIPYFGGDEIFKFQQRNQSWIGEYLAQPEFIKYQTPKASWFKVVFEKALNNFIGDFLESFSGRMQKRRIKIQDSIVVEKDELSFHPGNKGRQVLSRVPFSLLD